MQRNYFQFEREIFTQKLTSGLYHLICLVGQSLRVCPANYITKSMLVMCIASLSPLPASTPNGAEFQEIFMIGNVGRYIVKFSNGSHCTRTGSYAVFGLLLFSTAVVGAIRFLL